MRIGDRYGEFERKGKRMEMKHKYPYTLGVISYKAVAISSLIAALLLAAGVGATHILSHEGDEADSIVPESVHKKTDEIQESVQLILQGQKSMTPINEKL